MRNGERVMERIEYTDDRKSDVGTGEKREEEQRTGRMKNKER